MGALRKRCKNPLSPGVRTMRFTTVFVCVMPFFVGVGWSQVPDKAIRSVASTSNMNEVAMKMSDLPGLSGRAEVWGLEFSPDGEHLAVGVNNAVEIWNWRKNHLERTVKEPEGFIAGSTTRPLRYSERGSMFGSCVGTRYWTNIGARLGYERLVRQTRHHSDDAGFRHGDCFFARRQEFCLSGAIRSTCFLRGFCRHATWSRADTLALPDFLPVSTDFSPDGTVAVISGQKVVRPTDPRGSGHFEPRLYFVNVISKAEIIRTVDGKSLGSVAWSADGQRVAVAGGGHVEFINAHSGESLNADEEPNGGTMNAVFTSDSRYFIESDYDGLGHGLGFKIWTQRSPTASAS